VLIECPDCRHPIRIVDRRPGRFHPRCPKCDAVFGLVVPPRDEEEVTASSLAAAKEQDRVDEPLLTPEPAAGPILGERGRPSLRPTWLPRGVPRFLGGYIILRLLGHGPRGRALLARPVSLDDSAVLKVLAADRSGDPVFMAHHVREAFAATQIEHPNLVAIRRLDARRGRHYAAVEWLGGPSLAEVLRETPKVEAGRAAVMILQAARGLRAAHRQGLCHRDIKPENLRLDDQGLVKVDDLGLEMTPSLAAALEAKETGSSDRLLDVSAPASVARAAGEPPAPTSFPAAVGTPAYMAPEQARDPLAADGRADVYALGGTFYNLVTGRPPFSGQTAVELIRRHAEEPLIPPREFAPGLPRKVSEVIRTMLAKTPEEWYPSMDVVIDVLEGLLGLRTEATAAALSEAAETARQAALALAASPARRVRGWVLILSGVIWSAFMLLLIRLGLADAALVIFVLGSLTALFVAISSELTLGSELLRLTRAVVLGSGLWAWGLAGLLAAGALAFLLTSGGCLPLFLLVGAGGLAGACHVFLDRPLAAERERALAGARESLRQLRGLGHDEEKLREVFSAKGNPYGDRLAGRLFGHGEERAARQRHSIASQAERSFRFPSWRDAMLSWLEKRVQDRIDRRHLRILQEAEEGRLHAQGVNLLTARRKARRIAKAMVLTAVEWRDETRLLATSEAVTAPRGPALLERLRRAAEAPEPVLEPHEAHPGAFRRRIDALANLLFGRRLRFLLGSVLLVLLAFWLDARGIVTRSQVREQAGEIASTLRRAVLEADPGVLRELRWKTSIERKRLDEPVDFDGLPEGPWKGIPGANLAIAAIVLLASTFSGHHITGLAAFLAALVALFGGRTGIMLPMLTDRLGLDAHSQTRVLALAILVLGFTIPRRKVSS
jgi:serine/threonine protein kinase